MHLLPPRMIYLGMTGCLPYLKQNYQLKSLSTIADVMSLELATLIKFLQPLNLFDFCVKK